MSRRRSGVRTTVAALAGCVAALASGGCSSAADFERRPVTSPAFPVMTSAPTQPARQRGVSWVAGRRVTNEHLEPLVGNNVNWIVQTPFGWQRRIDSPEVHLLTSGRILWGETDAGLETTTRLAHEVGIKTLLKPHLWITEAEAGKWRTDIAMNSLKRTGNAGSRATAGSSCTTPGWPSVSESTRCVSGPSYTKPRCSTKRGGGRSSRRFAASTTVR